jgi:hypothetical protein
MLRSLLVLSDVTYLPLDLYHLSHLATIRHPVDHLDLIMKRLRNPRISHTVVSICSLIETTKLIGRKAQRGSKDTDEMVPHTHRPWCPSPTRCQVEARSRI